MHTPLESESLFCLFTTHPYHPFKCNPPDLSNLPLHWIPFPLERDFGCKTYKSWWDAPHPGGKPSHSMKVGGGERTRAAGLLQPHGTDVEGPTGNFCPGWGRGAVGQGW